MFLEYYKFLWKFKKEGSMRDAITKKENISAKREYAVSVNIYLIFIFIHTYNNYCFLLYTHKYELCVHV